MQEYIIRRILYTIMTLFAVATILFFIFRVMPGDPTAQVISPALDEAAQARLKETFGLDKPLIVQYVLYLKNLVTLNWGRSYTTQHEVFGILKYRFWNTIFLMGAAMSFTLVFGAGLGMVMAWRRGGTLDVGSTVSALVLQSAPPFVTGILFLMILSYRLDLFPTGGMASPGMRLETGIQMLFSKDFLHHLVLPTITTAFYYLATPMLITDHKPWLDICNQYHAALPIDYFNLDIPTILQGMKGSFYDTTGHESILWEDEVPKLVNWGVKKI